MTDTITTQDHDFQTTLELTANPETVFEVLSTTYEQCSHDWGHFLHASLVSYLQTGTGHPVES